MKGMPVRRDPARGSMVDDKNTIEEEEEDIDESSVFDN